MRAYGSDRVRELPDGSIQLESQWPKPAWRERVPRTATSAEHPGTAVAWEDELFEVVDIEPLPRGYRYTLERWRDEHAVRVSVSYDEASERERVRDRRDVERRRRSRGVALAAAPLTGHLPAHVQEGMAREWGANAPLLTMISAGVQASFALIGIFAYVDARVGGDAKPPGWLLLLIAYLMADAAARSGIAFLQSRPLGSVFGLIGYTLFYAVAGRYSGAPPPLLDRHPGDAAIVGAASLSVDDRISIWEPLVTFLDSADQTRLRAYGYVHTRLASRAAVVVLLLSLAGIYSSTMTLRAAPRLSALTALGAAVLLAGEQVVRIRRLDRGPQPSVLRFVLRPLLRRLLPL